LFGKVSQEYKFKFITKLNDDLNTPEALAVVWEMLKDVSLSKGTQYKTLLDFDKILGLGLSKMKSEAIPFQIKNLAKERTLARKNKDWTKSDEIREQIESLGYTVRDTSSGQVIEKI
jgi:cysteinyl-tRNA synthetase